MLIGLENIIKLFKFGFMPHYFWQGFGNWSTQSRAQGSNTTGNTIGTGPDASLFGEGAGWTPEYTPEPITPGGMQPGQLDWAGIQQLVAEGPDAINQYLEDVYELDPKHNYATHINQLDFSSLDNLKKSFQTNISDINRSYLKGIGEIGSGLQSGYSEARDASRSNIAKRNFAFSGGDVTRDISNRRNLYDMWNTNTLDLWKTRGIDRMKAQDDYSWDYQTATRQNVEDFYSDITRALDSEAQRVASEGSGGGSCFYKNSKVTLKDGTKIKVSEVKYGDELQAMDTDGSIIYSKVVKDSRFNTKDSKTPYYYTVIKAGDETLRVTARHRIFVNGINKTLKAKHIYPTMNINIVKDNKLKSVKVDAIEHKMLNGKYDIYTECGSVIVDNIVCTIFDGPLPHKFALWAWKMANKFRWLYDLNYKWYEPLYRFTQVEPN